MNYAKTPPEYFRRMARASVRMAQHYSEQLRASLVHPDDVSDPDLIWHLAVCLLSYKHNAASYFRMWREEVSQ